MHSKHKPIKPNFAIWDHKSRRKWCRRFSLIAFNSASGQGGEITIEKQKEILISLFHYLSQQIFSAWYCSFTLNPHFPLRLAHAVYQLWKMLISQQLPSVNCWEFFPPSLSLQHINGSKLKHFTSCSASLLFPVIIFMLFSSTSPLLHHHFDSETDRWYV